jgi:hypothetical protein
MQHQPNSHRKHRLVIGEPKSSDVDVSGSVNGNTHVYLVKFGEAGCAVIPSQAKAKAAEGVETEWQAPYHVTVRVKRQSRPQTLQRAGATKAVVVSITQRSLVRVQLPLLSERSLRNQWPFLFLWVSFFKLMITKQKGDIAEQSDRRSGCYPESSSSRFWRLQTNRRPLTLRSNL